MQFPFYFRCGAKLIYLITSGKIHLRYQDRIDAGLSRRWKSVCFFKINFYLASRNQNAIYFR